MTEDGRISPPSLSVPSLQSVSMTTLHPGPLHPAWQTQRQPLCSRVQRPCPLHNPGQPSEKVCPTCSCTQTQSFSACEDAGGAQCEIYHLSKNKLPFTTTSKSWVTAGTNKWELRKTRMIVNGKHPKNNNNTSFFCKRINHTHQNITRQPNTPTWTRAPLTNVTVLSLPARLAHAGPIVALAVLFAARMACSLVARSANPTLLALALAFWANAVAATWHRAQLCRTGGWRYAWEKKHLSVRGEGNEREWNRWRNWAVEEGKNVKEAPGTQRAERSFKELGVSHWIQVRKKITSDRKR